MQTSERNSLNALAGIAIAILVLGAVAGFGQQKSKTALEPNPKSTPTAIPKATPSQSNSDPAKCTARNGLTLAEINQLLAAHNDARYEQYVGPLQWDCTLAGFAQEWADQSIYEHREFSSYGENIFVSANPAEPIASVVKRWMLEKPNWNNETAT